MMNLIRSYCSPVLLASLVSLASAGTRPDFTVEELNWIKSHPFVNYVADSQVRPFEFVEDGEYRGLAAEYLREITRISGLNFRLVATADWEGAQRAFLDHEADLFPNLAAHRVSQQVSSQLSFTEPYFVATTIVVTRADEPVTLNLKDLDGKVVAMREGGFYPALVARLYPGIQALLIPASSDLLEAVVDGRAHAALGPDLAFLPMMRRGYAGKLSVSGAVGELAYTIRMGVRSDLPVLHSIIAKSLGSMSAEDTDVMNDRWLAQTDFGKPSLVSIIRYRTPDLLLLGAGIALLGWFAYRARAAERVAQASELTKSRFLAVMSHEIRTPMNAVLASIEMLQRTPMDERQRRFASTASIAAEALLDLLDDVLDLSKLDAKRLELELIPTDIGVLGHKVAALMQVRAQSKALSVTVNLDNPSGHLALIDPTRLRQVLVNLMGNSVKFTERGGLTLDLRLVDLDGLHGMVSIAVRDTGIGIALDQQSRLFEAYAQADSSTTRRFGGTGLGLTICKELIELMGGQVKLESTAGVGTTISFTLPVRLAIPPESGPSEVCGTPTVARIQWSNNAVTVLVVDDHPGNQFIIAEQLRELGVRAKIVGDGIAALAEFQSETYSLILMDCHMPDMSGYEVTRRIREGEAAAGAGDHVPVIAISAATDAAHLRKCMDSGMDGVLKKPMRLDELAGMLQMWLGHVRASSDQRQLSDVDLNAVYVKTMEEDLEALQRACSIKDQATAAHLAHRIKGAALMADAGGIASRAEELEDIICSSDVEDREKELHALRQLEVEIWNWRTELT